MNAAGIDVCKGKSIVSVMQSLGVVSASRFKVAHTLIEMYGGGRVLASAAHS